MNIKEIPCEYLVNRRKRIGLIRAGRADLL